MWTTVYSHGVDVGSKCGISTFGIGWAPYCAGFSRGKGQDLFLHAFSEALQLRAENADTSAKLGQMHAFLVGSDFDGSQKYEIELIDMVKQKGLQHLVHFVNKTLHVAPYLAASDVLVQNSQVWHAIVPVLLPVVSMFICYLMLWSCVVIHSFLVSRCPFYRVEENVLAASPLKPWHLRFLSW